LTIDSAKCDGENKVMYADKQGDLKLLFVEDDQTTPSDSVTNGINDGVIVKGKNQDFAVTLKLEENASDSVFGNGIVPIAIALDYNTTSFDDVEVKTLGGALYTLGTKPNYLSSNYDRFYITDFSQIGEFAEKSVKIAGDLNNLNAPDGLNYNITTTVVDGNGYFHSVTGALEYGYENNTNNNIGVITDPSLTLVVKPQ